MLIHRNAALQDRSSLRVRCSLFGLAVILGGFFPVLADQTWLVSRAVPSSTPSWWTQPHAVSADGRFAVLSSAATGWVSGVVDSNGGPDVYLADLLTGEITLVSHMAGDPATASISDSYPAAISDDGRYVTYSSTSWDLVDGVIDDNFVPDVFLWDRLSGESVLVSQATAGPSTVGNERSSPCALTSDGRFVLFQSLADNLIAGGLDQNLTWDAFVWDRDTAAVELISHQAADPGTAGNGAAEPAAITDDGRFVVFTAFATDLVAGASDSNGVEDAFLWDRLDATMTLVSHAASDLTMTANNASLARAISADGRYVFLDSGASDLTSPWGGPGGVSNVFVWDRENQLAELVSHAAGSATTGGDDDSRVGAVSADGRTLAFASLATSLVVGGVDTNDLDDTYVWNADLGTIVLVSHIDGFPTDAGNQGGIPVAISDDGQYLLFSSASSDLIAEISDANGGLDAFLWDRVSEVSTLVSRASGPSAESGNSFSTPHAMSGDGEWVAIASYADDLVSGGSDGNGVNDAYLWNRSSGATALLSSASQAATTGANDVVSGVELSDDGLYVVFQSAATNLVAGGGDANGQPDVFHWDRELGLVTLVSHSAGNATVAGNGASEGADMGSEGRFVAYSSQASDLILGGVDGNGGGDVFLWDRLSAQSTLVSHHRLSPTTAANGVSAATAISADGRFVTLQSQATDMITGVLDLNFVSDAFLWDRLNGTMTLVSGIGSSPRVAANDASVPTALSDDGRFVAFYSAATNLVNGQSDANGGIEDAFLFDRDTLVVTLVSHVVGAATTTANDKSVPLAVSADGAFVAFASRATNLALGNDGNSAYDLFLWERSSGLVTLISHAALSVANTADDFSAFKALSADGRFVVFVSGASDLVEGGIDTNGPSADAYIWDRLSGSVQLVSHAAGATTTTADSSSEPEAISADGRYVALSSSASDLIDGIVDVNAAADVFVWDRLADTMVLASHTLADPTASASGRSSALAMSADGTFVLFASDAQDLVPASTSSLQAYLWSATTVDTTPPLAPGIDSTSPAISTWWNGDVAEVSWSGAEDEVGGSGLLGYSIEWDTSPETTPDGVVDEPHATDPNSVASPALVDGDTHHLHLAACDAAGNCALPLHVGPFWIDTAPPGAAPGLASSSHNVGVPSSNRTVEVHWQAAPDQAGLSGIEGYGFAFLSSAGWVCDELIDADAETLSTASDPLDDGSWYFHLCARDIAGSWGAVSSIGPFVIDAAAVLFADGFESADTSNWDHTVP